MKILHRTIATAVMLAAVAIGCGSTADPSSEQTGQTAEAQCANGVVPGCSPCYADPTSPKGGFYECYTCAGTAKKTACVPPAPCGGSGEPCCDPTYTAQPCSNTNYCSGGKCNPCGGAGEPCCTKSVSCVGSNLVCNGGTCDYCGGHGEPCCDGACNSAPDVCDHGTCLTCLNQGFSWTCQSYDPVPVFTNGWTTPACTCKDAAFLLPFNPNANCWIDGCP